MDFSNRTTQPQPVAPTHAPVGSSAGHRKGNANEGGKWTRWGTILVSAAVIILLIAVTVAVSFANNNTSDNEGTYVDTNKLQAVFLNTGQVYFGNVKKLNDKYVVLTNIYYLQTSNGSSGTSSTSSNSNTSVSLVKLGCELHEPYDQMVINRSQVTFWENLQDGGQVAKAVKTFQQQNPNGQKCTDQSSSASTTSGNATQNAGTSKP
jgi:hypothetical protein